MSTLRDLTHKNHEEAEAHPFTKLMLSGNMPGNIYGTFLANQLVCYMELEGLARSKGLLNGIEGIARSEHILRDIVWLGQPVYIGSPALKYVEHIKTLDEKQLLAHIYVRHMGDMYGGQLMKTKLPGKGYMFDFENRSELVKALREKLDVSMADEANVCFTHVLKLFDRLALEFGIQ